MSIDFATWPPRTHLLHMKPVGGPGRASQCSALKKIFEKIASLSTSSLTPGLPKMQAGVALPLLKILITHFWLQLLLRESSMKKTTPLNQPWLHCITILCQARLHHQTPTSTLLHLLLQLGTSRSSVFKPFWSLLTKGGEAYEVDSLQAGPYGWLLYFC